MTHTSEPWMWDGKIWDHDPENEAPWLVSSSVTKYPDNVILKGNSKYGTMIINEANAKRIVACVNACAGIPTPSLESGAIQAMVEALELAEPEMGFSGWFSGTGSMSAEKRKVAANAVSKALALMRGESGKGEGL